MDKICNRFSNKFLEDLEHYLNGIDHQIKLNKNKECQCNKNGFCSRSKDGYPIGFYELADHFKTSDNDKMLRWKYWSKSMKILTIDKVCKSNSINIPENIKNYLHERLEFEDFINHKNKKVTWLIDEDEDDKEEQKEEQKYIEIKANKIKNKEKKNVIKPTSKKIKLKKLKTKDQKKSIDESFTNNTKTYNYNNKYDDDSYYLANTIYSNPFNPAFFGFF